MNLVIINPTYNEKKNIEILINRFAKLRDEIEKLGYNLIQLVVDDNSPDKTSIVVKRLQKKHSFVRLINGRREGLGKAIIRGMKYAMEDLKADIIVTMDADLQHEPEALPKMLEKMNEGYDLVIGARHVKGGTYPKNWGWYRMLNTTVAGLTSRFIAGIKGVHDTTSGYRVIRIKDYLNNVDLDNIHAEGYSFEFVLLAKLIQQKVRIFEFPIHFRERKHGKSKVGMNKQYIKDVIEFMKNAALIRIENSQTLIKFLVVGAIGTIVNLIVYRLSAISIRSLFIDELIAGEISILSNYLLNHFWTFKESRVVWWKALITYNITSAISVLIASTTVAIIASIFGNTPQIWYAFVGIVLGTIWNYFVSSKLIWNSESRILKDLIKNIKSHPILSMYYGIIILAILISVFANLLYVNNNTWFSGDEGRDLLIVSNMLSTHKPILQGGPSNIHTAIGNFFFSPIFWYMLVPGFLLLHGVPTEGVYMQIFLFFLTLPFLYLGLKKFIGSTASYFVILMYPLSYYVIEINRHSWNPNPVISFVALLIFSLSKLYEQKERYFILFVFSLAMCILLDYSGGVILPFAIIALFIVISLKKIKLSTYIYSAIVLFILLSPQIYNEIKYKFPNTKVLLYYIFKTPKFGHSFGYQLSSWFNMLSTFIAHVYGTFPVMLASIVFLLGLAFLIYLYIKNRKKELLITLLYVTLPIITVLFYPGIVAEHYFYVSSLALFIVLGVFFQFLWQNKYNALKVIPIFIVFAYLFSNIQELYYLSPNTYKSLSNKSQLSEYLNLASSIKSKYASTPIDIVYGDKLAGYPTGFKYILQYENINIDPNSNIKVTIPNSIGY